VEVEAARTLAIPGIGLGTLGNQGDEGAALVEAALVEGYRYIDTGRYYGNEEAVGAGLQRASVPRDQVILTTKLLHPKTAPMTDLTAELDRSLRSLQTDYVDLLLMHWPNPAISLDWVLGEFERMRELGRVREFGVSNFTTGLLAEALAISDQVAVNQVEYHPYLGQRSLRDRMRAANITLTAHSPLARGAVVDDPVLLEIAAGRGVTAAQIALRWLVQQEGVVAIPGARAVNQLRENIAVLELALSDDEMAAVAGLERGLRIIDPPHAPAWDPAD
jgi:diketogulonate reductase-like aldo/keto reductase